MPDGTLRRRLDDRGQDGSGYGIFGQRYDATGARVGGEFQVQHATAGNQQAAVRAHAARRRVRRGLGEHDSASRTTCSRGGSTPPATAIGAEFQVNTYTTGTQFMYAIRHRRPGQLRRDLGQRAATATASASAAAASADGTPRGAEFQVNTFTTGTREATVASDEVGNFVVAWHGHRAGTAPSAASSPSASAACSRPRSA